MIKRWIYWILGYVLLTAATILGTDYLLILFQRDEAPLDYSSMDIRTGPKDPLINGYTALRELTSSETLDLGDDWLEISHTPKSEWDASDMQAIVARNDWVFPKIEAIFAKPEFRIDQAVTPETRIVGFDFIRKYLSLKLMKSRLALLAGEYNEALNQLLELEAQFRRLSQADGPLISFFVSMSAYQMLNSEFSNFLAEAQLDSSAFKEAAHALTFHEGLTEALQSAAQHEFNFAVHGIQRIQSKPVETIRTWGIIDEIDFSQSEFFLEKNIRVAFKPGSTKNLFFKYYSELKTQAELPAKDRTYPFTEHFYGSTTYKRKGGHLADNQIGHLLLGTLLPDLGQVQKRIDLSKAASAATKINFALRAYHLDSGQLPESLEALTPEYLNAIPIDPFDGKPMRYSKEKAIIYSVGDDFIDSGGSTLDFQHQLGPGGSNSAESDESEPSFPIRFAM